MKIRWQKLLLKLTIWLGVEIILTLTGLDDMADYNEFLFIQNNTATATIKNCIV